MQKNFLPYAFHQGEWKPFSEAQISIATHALHYGTAAFGGMRAFVNPRNSNEIVLFRLEKHARRLAESATFFDCPFDTDFFQKTVIEFLQRNKPTTSVYLRPLLYTSDLDISPRLHDIEWDFLLYGLEMGDYLSSDGIRCTISSWMRQSDASFPLRGKISGAYITSALAKTQAIKRGFDEAILLNAAGKVSEGSAMNIFMVRNGVLRTPAVTEDILEGITRASVIELARYLGYTVLEEQIDASELLIADEVFFTGTAARLTPVKAIEHFKLPETRPVFDHLKSSFDQILSGDFPHFQEWRQIVSL